jgi:hypothetical protein
MPSAYANLPKKQGIGSGCIRLNSDLQKKQIPTFGYTQCWDFHFIEVASSILLCKMLYKQKTTYCLVAVSG